MAATWSRNSGQKFRVQILQTWITLFRQWNLLVQTRHDIADCVVRVKARLDRARPEAFIVSSRPVEIASVRSG